MLSLSECVLLTLLTTANSVFGEINRSLDFANSILNLTTIKACLSDRRNRFDQYEVIKLDPFDTEDPTTQTKVIFRSDLFNREVLYYAFLITLENYAQPPENGTWNNTRDWPPLPNWEDANVPHQVTPVRWNPFPETGKNSDVLLATYILGDGSFENSFYWNKPLMEKTRYAFKIRGFTVTQFQDTEVIYFETLEKFPIFKVASMLGGLFCITAVAVYISLFDSDTVRRAFWGKKSRINLSPFPRPLSHKNFLKYTQELLSIQGRLANEFHLLGTLSSDVSTLCLHAQRVDNRKKNRYGNILPFDVTRVKLSVIDNDPSTDYINASYIKGYTNKVEYIACQGPLEETCYDFYRMILEKNIEIIVMLTALTDNEQEKCFKYYPNEKNFKRVRNISVFCKEESDFDFFKKRILTIQDNDKELTLQHFHYKEWPDFVGPNSINNILKFFDFVRKNRGKGFVVVHCNAGAGRTGTFIAIDILLQNIKNNNKINVFNTVLKLRQQRVGMVQTEVQLGFIYKCISNVIENSSQGNKEIV